MSRHFDLCIIGTGSGNTILDEHFDDWTVAIVERDRFGGTCTNRGCIPSKMLIYPADVVEMVRRGESVGVDAFVEEVRWTDIRDRTFARIDHIAEDGERYRREAPNVTVFAEDARFVGPMELQVGDETITADRFVLAAGASPHIPAIPGLDEVHFETSDTVMRIAELPERLVVVGGGFIAAEMSHIFDAYGACVTIVSRRDQLLRDEDAEISRRITDRIEERFDLRLRTTPTRVEQNDGVIKITLEGPDGRDVVETDMLLLAAGRFPNGGLLNVEVTGVTLDPEGYVITDPTMATGAEGIWALGDMRNHLQFKHMANLDARIIRHNLLHPEAPCSIDERFTPHAVFTNPQIAAVGLTESQAEMHGRAFVTTVREFASVAYGWAMEDTTSCAKLIADVETRHLIGAHIIGPQASLLLQQLVQGMRFELTVDQMAEDVIYPHPALSEVVENALLDLVDALG